MRTVAAVVALVACVHAGLWALSRDHISAPNYDGQLASVSYAPFEGNVHPDAGGLADADHIRADLKLLAPLRAPSALIRQPAASKWCQASLPSSDCG
jgi:hypothetical protein